MKVYKERRLQVANVKKDTIRILVMYVKNVSYRIVNSVLKTDNAKFV